LKSGHQIATQGSHPNNRDYSLTLVNPFGRASKNSKAKLLRNFNFFTLQCLQKEAFDALKQKSQPFG
jgi:hypothetical protein